MSSDWCAGASDKLRGNVTGSLPEGLTSPINALAMARPPSIPGVPGHEDCGYLVGPVHRDRAARNENDDGSRVGAHRISNELDLLKGKLEVLSVSHFRISARTVAQAHEEQGGVGLLGRVHPLHLGPELFLEASQRRDFMGGAIRPSFPPTRAGSFALWPSGREPRAFELDRCREEAGRLHF